MPSFLRIGASLENQELVPDENVLKLFFDWYIDD
jgi:hypothetical protein